MSRIKDLPSASSLSLSDYIAVDQALGTKKTTVEGLANKVGEVIGRNDNLLLNGWFKINQRATTSGDFTSAYRMDRWKASAGGQSTGTWTLSSSGLAIDNTIPTANSYFTQVFANNIDDTKTYTASIMLSDGTILSKTGTLPFSLSEDSRVGINAYNYRFQFYVKAGQTATIRAVKLELGATSTLAYDVAPNYTEELAKCRWYFRRVNCPQNGGVAFGFVNSATLALIMLAQVGEMRVVPTLSSSGSFHIMIDSNTEYSVTLSLPAAINKEQILIKAEGIGMTAGKDAMLYASSSGAYIDLDAEIY